jgi:hypothetical protein
LTGADFLPLPVFLAETVAGLLLGAPLGFTFAAEPVLFPGAALLAPGEGFAGLLAECCGAPEGWFAAEG